jgi:hypothetical protein
MRNSSSRKSEIATLTRRLRTVVAALEATTNRLRRYESLENNYPHTATTSAKDRPEESEFDDEHPPKSENNGEDCVDCVLCLEPVRGFEEHAQIPLCRHLFHASCFDKCVRDLDRCPICRCPIGSLLLPEAGTRPFPQGRIGEAPPTPPSSPPATSRWRHNNFNDIIQSDPFFFPSEILHQVFLDALFPEVLTHN